MKHSTAMRSVAALGATAAIGLAGLTAAGSADAASRDGYCDPGEFCLYYNSWQLGYGSGSDFSGSVRDYGSTQPQCYEFRGPGNGRGQCVKNHAAAYWNRTSHNVQVYVNSGWRGSYITIPPGAYGNLPSWLKNNEASHKVL